MQKLEKKVSAVLVAAGSSTRMGFDKLSFDLGGETVVQRSVRAFAECPLVSEIVLVAGKNRAFLEQQAAACAKPVQLTQGDYANLKITTREDLPRAEQKEGNDMRIGHGYDVHRLVEDRKLILGGVEVPFEKGLLGHSDADVLAHAVMDAVLGAAALGDIGKHFPDTDPAYAGADSLQLAQHVARIMREHGWKIVNIDSTLLCQKPKLAPYIPAMRENLAAAFGMPVDAVSVKATTEEHLGFTGEGLGIAAHAVALIEKL